MIVRNLFVARNESRALAISQALLGNPRFCNSDHSIMTQLASAEINSSLVLGAFTRDMVDGTVRFRYTLNSSMATVSATTNHPPTLRCSMEIPVVNNLLTFKQLDHCVMTTIYAIDMYYPKLMKILWDEVANVKQILSQDS